MFQSRLPEARTPRRSFLLGAGALATAAVVAGAPAAQASPQSTLVDPDTPRNARPNVGGGGQQLILSDEFNGTNLDTSKWNAVEQHRSPGNNGVDYWYKADNVSVSDGALGLAISRLGTDSYGGARVDTQGKFNFTFGTIEYRMYVPPTIGHLAAAWLQATNGLTPGGAVDGTARDGAEIDIAETFSTTDQYGVTVHWDGYGADHQQSNTVVEAPRLHRSHWHTFTLNWSPTQMTFGYDGTVVRTITDPDLISQVDEFAIVSNEVIPYAQGDIHNAPLDASSTVLVDYIRIWA